MAKMIKPLLSHPSIVLQSMPLPPKREKLYSLLSLLSNTQKNIAMRKTGSELALLSKSLRN